MKQAEIINKKLAKILFYILALIIILLPFHAFFTTWIGSVLGNILFWRAWKELLLVAGVIIALLLFFKDKKLRSALLHDRLIVIGSIFALWMLLVTVLLMRDYVAAALGLAIQVRLFAVFLLARVVMFYRTVSTKTIYQLVLIPAGIVTVLGLLQMFVLPRDFLTHFGYQKGITIPPFFTIDEQLNRLRAFSTLRGPNPLGVYLTLPIMFMVSLLPKFWRKGSWFVIASSVALVSMLVLLYGSHSRSAWLGMLVALGVYIYVKSSKKVRYIVIAVGTAGSLLLGAGIYQFRNTEFVKDMILHDDPIEGGAVSSNEGHSEAFKEGLSDIQQRPVLGCGAGCAGPASFHNNEGANISENYFLQTIQEGGLIALGLMATIFLIIMWRLLQTGSTVSYSLLSVFIGVGIASMLSHAWADDTIAYLWWSLAGLALYAESHHASQAQATVTRRERS